MFTADKKRWAVKNTFHSSIQPAWSTFNAVLLLKGNELEVFFCSVSDSSSKNANKKNIYLYIWHSFSHSPTVTFDHLSLYFASFVSYLLMFCQISYFHGDLSFLTYQKPCSENCELWNVYKAFTSGIESINNNILQIDVNHGLFFSQLKTCWKNVSYIKCSMLSYGTFCWVGWFVSYWS